MNVWCVHVKPKNDKRKTHLAFVQRDASAFNVPNIKNVGKGLNEILHTGECSYKVAICDFKEFSAVGWLIRRKFRQQSDPLTGLV